MNALPVSHPHYPFAPHYILASLVKGRWIDGTTQTFVLLLPARDMPTFFILQTFLPSRRRDCHFTTSCPAPTLPNRTIPCFIPPLLPLYERFVGFASLRNFGHPCPPSKKGEVLLLGQAEPTMVGIAPHPHNQ